MFFEKVNQPRFKKKSSFIAEQLITLIRTGRFPEGSKLPAERLIAEQMGVSRPSLREAVSALQLSGFLESRPGDGTYVVRVPSGEESILSTVQTLESCDSPFENIHVRKIMEVGAVRLAVEVATDEDIRRLAATWQHKLELGRAGHLEEYLRYGKEFHMAIARATKNRLLESIMEKLLALASHPFWIGIRREFFRNSPGQFPQMLDIHDRIVKAIAVRDADLAAREMEYHFDIQLEQIYNRGEDNGFKLLPTQERG
jgi:GntR family transcriptional repressor for pyruvate dehydrogenase complex